METFKNNPSKIRVYSCVHGRTIYIQTPGTYCTARVEDQNDVGLTQWKPRFDLGTAQVTSVVGKVTLGLVFLRVLLQFFPDRIISTMTHPHLSQTPHKLVHSQCR